MNGRTDNREDLGRNMVMDFAEMNVKNHLDEMNYFVDET